MSSTGAARSPRVPSSTIIVDSNIILSVVLGQKLRSVFAIAEASRLLATSSRVVEEVRGVANDIPNVQPKVIQAAEVLLAGIRVIDGNVYAGLIDGAARALRQAVPSRNGSEKDAHLLACAWAFDADIWSHDRDFAGTGWPSWSTANLRDVLEAEVATVR